MTRRALAYFVVVSVLWGVPYLFVAVGLDSGLGALTVVASRVCVGAAILLPVTWRSVGCILRKSLVRVAVLALVEVIAPFALIAAGQRTVDSSTAGVLIATEPMFVLLWSCLIAKGSRSVQRTGLFGMLLGFVGVVVLLGTPGTGTGALLIVAAAASYGLGAVLVGAWFPDTPSLPLAAAMLGLAAPVTVVLAAAIDGPPSFTGTATLAMLALGLACTAAGFSAFFALIAAAGAHRAALITYVAPVVALAAGSLFRDEAITWTSILGTLIILAGASMVLHTPERNIWSRLPGRRVNSLANDRPPGS